VAAERPAIQFTDEFFATTQAPALHFVQMRPAERRSSCWTLRLQRINVLAYLTAAIHCHRRGHVVASLLQKRGTP
jgi:hypothetical protein